MYPISAPKQTTKPAPLLFLAFGRQPFSAKIPRK